MLHTNLKNLKNYKDICVIFILNFTTLHIITVYSFMHTHFIQLPVLKNKKKINKTFYF